MKILPVFLLLGLCSCSTNTAWHKFAHNYQASHPDQPIPYYFWRGPGLVNGQIVLDGIRSSDAESRTKVGALIGSPVVFIGEGNHLRKDIWSDIVTDDHIEILVDIVPFQAVRPGPCAQWGVEVKGKLESVDFEKRVIRVEAKPEDWKDIWQI
jgi:hypothetical protein